MLDSKSDNKPLISIILPFFNARSTIARCIESILSQTLANFELICINDVTPDDSQNIVEKYMVNDSRVVLLKNKTNIGLGATRNKGVMNAIGSYVFHIDPDDNIPSQSLKVLYDSAIKYKSDMVKGSFISDQVLLGQKSRKSVQSLCKKGTPMTNTNLKKMPALLNTTGGHWSYLYKTDFAKKVPYPTDLKMGQDSIFLVNALVHAEKITIIDDVVYHYCTNHTSAMNTFNFRKYMDALEWRRRAWHSLKEAGMKKLGDRLLQSYWSDIFFIKMPQILSRIEVGLFFQQYRNVIVETGVTVPNNNNSPFLIQLFDLIIEKKEEEEAYQMMLKAYKNTSIN
jgi:glycosyltransferase involved in cell wall biosynthesis